MCKVMAVVSPDLAPGFELAGIEAARARNAREASVALQSAVENGEYGSAIAYASVLVVLMLVAIGGIQRLVGERRVGRRGAST